MALTDKMINKNSNMWQMMLDYKRIYTDDYTEMFGKRELSQLSRTELKEWLEECHMYMVKDIEEAWKNIAHYG